MESEWIQRGEEPHQWGLKHQKLLEEQICLMPDPCWLQENCVCSGAVSLHPKTGAAGTADGVSLVAVTTCQLRWGRSVLLTSFSSFYKIANVIIVDFLPFRPSHEATLGEAGPDLFRSFGSNMIQGCSLHHWESGVWQQQGPTASLKPTASLRWLAPGRCSSVLWLISPQFKRSSLWLDISLCSARLKSLIQFGCC